MRRQVYERSVFRLIVSIFAFAPTSFAGAQPQYRAVSVEHIWQDRQVPITVTADLGEKEEIFRLHVNAEIVGSASDAFESAESLDKLEDLIRQGNCNSSYAPKSVVSFNYEQYNLFGLQRFTFNSPTKIASDTVTSIRLKYLEPRSSQIKITPVSCDVSDSVLHEQKSLKPEYYQVRSIVSPYESIEVKGAAPIYFSKNHPFEIKFSVLGQNYKYKGSGFIASPVSYDTRTSPLGEKMTGKEIADKVCQDFDKNPDYFVLYFDTMLRDSISSNGRIIGKFALPNFNRKANAVGAIEIGIEDQGGIHPVMCL